MLQRIRTYFSERKARSQEKEVREIYNKLNFDQRRKLRSAMRKNGFKILDNVEPFK